MSAAADGQPDPGRAPAPSPTTAAAAAEDWSDRVSLTFTLGVYLAINAINDAYLIVDAPDCAHLKTQFLQGNHDWFSTITSVTGVHRIANTDLHPWKMVPARDEALTSFLRQMARYDGAGAVLITSMPMATITGVDYERLTRAVAAETGRPVVNVPGNSLSGDWLDGYAATLKGLAQTLPLAPEPRDGEVAVVGYLWDRNEGDHQANVAEMGRLLGGLGLRVASTWLSGGSTAELRAAQHAQAVLSLPYGREAARVLGQRLGVPVVELDLPMGLGASERWLRQVAAALGREARVDAVVDAELARAVPRLEWVVPCQLLHRAMVFVGEPHLALGFEELAGELGLRVAQHVIVTRRAHAAALLERCGAERVLIDPKRDRLNRCLASLMTAGDCQLLVTNSMGVMPGPCQAAILEIGFPSFFTHALEDRPFMFFRGLTSLVTQMANELRRTEIITANPADRGR